MAGDPAVRTRRSSSWAGRSRYAPCRPADTAAVRPGADPDRRAWRAAGSKKRDGVRLKRDSARQAMDLQGASPRSYVFSFLEEGT
jgi:hypothetical protein